MSCYNSCCVRRKVCNIISWVIALCLCFEVFSRLDELRQKAGWVTVFRYSMDEQWSRADAAEVCIRTISQMAPVEYCSDVRWPAVISAVTLKCLLWQTNQACNYLSQRHQMRLRIILWMRLMGIRQATAFNDAMTKRCIISFWYSIICEKLLRP